MASIFFDAYWALFKRLWLYGMSIFVGAIVYVEYLGETPETDLALIPVLFIVELIFGHYGNTWRGKNLLKSDCMYKGIMSASTPKRAIELFLANYSH